jgi:tetratricopeptide (TPR) repeat protein
VLYDWQPEEATRMWEAAAALDPSFAIVHRNLATAYAHLKQPDLDRAIAELEKAVTAEHKYALHFTELDELYQQAGVPLEKRVPLFERNAGVVTQRDDAENRAVALKVASGAYDDAIKMMTGRPFAVAEGANLNVSEHWADAHILRARKEVEGKRYQEALSDLKAAVTVPSNLPLGAAGFGAGARNAEVGWWTGLAYEGLGDREKAMEAWRSAATPAPAGGGRRGGQMGGIGMGGSAQSYYQGLALQKLGQADPAKALFNGLVESGKSAMQQPAAGGAGRGGRGGRGQSPRARDANAHYLAGLGYLGLNDRAQAKTELAHAVELSPDLVGARVALASIE